MESGNENEGKRQQSLENVKTIYYFEDGAFNLSFQSVEKANDFKVPKSLKNFILNKLNNQNEYLQQIHQTQENSINKFVMSSKYLFFWDNYMIKYFDLRKPFDAKSSEYLKEIDLKIDKN